MPPSFHATVPFLKFLLVGAAVGIAASAFIYAVESWFVQTSRQYALTVLSVYAVGIACSFVGHSRFAFRNESAPTPLMEKSSIRSFTKHAVVASILGVVVAIASSFVRLSLSPFLSPSASAATAFALCTIAASVISFTVNRRWVFHDK